MTTGLKGRGPGAPAPAGARQICFVVMPFGKKRVTGAGRGAPRNVDFDALWDEAIRPGIEAAGFLAARADQDWGPIVFKDMVARLALADVVVADISLGNPNVYYELGIRHGFRDSGCVAIAARWCRPAFDLLDVRRVQYDLAGPKPTEVEAASIQQVVRDAVAAAHGMRSPLKELGLQPLRDADARRAAAFVDYVAGVNRFEGRLKAIREGGDEGRSDRARALLADYPITAASSPALVVQLTLLVRDVLGFEAVATFIDRLPDPHRGLAAIREQRALATDKASRKDTTLLHGAIAELEALVADQGPTPERLGLIGGRFKALYLLEEERVRADAGRPTGDRDRYLDHAIDNYQAGMDLEFDEYYCACNLPRLYRKRGRNGDADLALIAATIAEAAARKAMKADPDDPWIAPTLLGAAVDRGDVQGARAQIELIQHDSPPAWFNQTTLVDVRAGVQLLDDALRAAFQPLIDKLEELCRP